MTPQDFLAVVLPSPNHGLYCTAELSTKKKDHVFAQTIGEALAPIDNWVQNKNNTYFALATFDPAVTALKRDRRTAKNARYIRSFFIDMDGYASNKQAALALNAFLEATELATLGVPWVVGSGGGLHCYWPLTETVKVEDWKPVAENLKRLCKQEQLRIDMTVTADTARVLRVPGTVNFKEKYPEPRPVRILAAGDTFDFSAFASLIASKLTTPAPAVPAPKTDLVLEGKRPKAPPTATAVALFENTVTKFRNILTRTKEGTGCAQLKYYVENATEDGMEPLWRGWLSQAKVCADGEKAVVWLSKLHPYDEDRMHAKLREIKGPYPCVKFDSENPGICTSCLHFGKITNPLALGREYALEDKGKEVEAPNTDSPIKLPDPPHQFQYGKNGGVFYTKVTVDPKTKDTHTDNVMVLPYTLFVVDILNSQGTHIVHMLALKPHEGAINITMPQKAMASKDECIKMLAQQNIMASFGSGNDANLYAYVRACVEQASVGKVAVKLPSSYGWQPDDTFVFAGQIYAPRSKPLPMPMPGLDNIVHNTRPTGTIEAWRMFVELLVAKRMYKHLAIMLAGAGSPLMRFTGIYGMTFHCGSTESGTGKTLALEAAASVWGHPTHYRTGKATSAVAMQQRLGLLNSLPLITDEITSKNRTNAEWLPEFLFDVSEGRGKERMDAGANKERLNLSTWMANAILSSNTHATDTLTGGRMHASEGELRRLLDFIMDSDLKWEPAEIEIIKSLQTNYAVAGHILAQYMADNVSMLKEMMPRIVQEAYREFGATNDERFWMAGIATIIGAGALFSKKHAGIADVPMQGIIEAVKEVVEGMRVAVRGNKRTAEDVLNSYTRDNVSSFIMLRKDKKTHELQALFGGKAIDENLPRSRIMGRIEQEFEEGYIDYFIEESLLRAYCASMSFGYADFKTQIAKIARVSRMARKDMTARTKGPQMRVSVLRIQRKIEESPDVELLLSVDADSQG